MGNSRTEWTKNIPISFWEIVPIEFVKVESIKSWGIFNPIIKPKQKVVHAYKFYQGV